MIQAAGIQQDFRQLFRGGNLCIDVAAQRVEVHEQSHQEQPGEQGAKVTDQTSSEIHVARMCS